MTSLTTSIHPVSPHPILDVCEKALRSVRRSQYTLFATLDSHPNLDGTHANERIMTAAILPTELLQLVYDCLDPRDFYSARRVCKKWFRSSNARIILRKQLAFLPVIQPCHPDFHHDLNALRAMFDKAAYIHMMGMQVTKSLDVATAYARKINKSKYAVSSDGLSLAAVDSLLLTVYNATEDDFDIVHEQRTNSYKWMSGAGPWFKSSPNACFELAISTDKTVVAIALERTIQLYKPATPEFLPLSKWLAPACGDYIVGVEFTPDDHLLRLQLSKGHVIYLGEPSKAHDELDTFTYWESAIHQVYLDTATTQLITPTSSTASTPSLHPHHLRLFPPATSSTSTSTTAPFLIHSDTPTPFLFYTGTYHPPTTAARKPPHLTITGAIPAHGSPHLPPSCFTRPLAATPLSFPGCGSSSSSTRTARSPCGRLFAVCDVDHVRSMMRARPWARVHLCRWPEPGTAAGAQGEGVVWGFPTLLGRVEGGVLGLSVEACEVGSVAAEERYRVLVRTDERVVVWDVRLPALGE